MEEFDVIFYDEDEKTILDMQRVKKGEPVRYNGEIPEKEPENSITYTFDGWIGEEKMDCVTESFSLVARYVSDLKTNELSSEESLLKMSLINAQKANISAIMNSGQKVNNQEKALLKDSRTPEEIVNAILKDGKVEIENEVDKDDITR